MAGRGVGGTANIPQLTLAHYMLLLEYGPVMSRGRLSVEICVYIQQPRVERGGCSGL